MPSIRPTFWYILLTRFAGSLQIFDIIYTTTNGGPNFTTEHPCSYTIPAPSPPAHAWLCLRHVGAAVCRHHAGDGGALPQDEQGGCVMERRKCTPAQALAAIPVWVLLAVLALVVIVPISWILLGTFKPEKRSSPIHPPSGPKPLRWKTS